MSNDRKVAFVQIKKLLGKSGIEIALLFIIILASLASPKFFQVANIINVLRQVAVTGVISIGMTIVIINGGIDLSVNGIIGLSGMVAVIIQGMGGGSLLAILAACAIGASCGAINGFFISKGLAPFIMTMAMDTVVRGIAYLTSGGQPVSGVGTVYKFLGSGSVFSVPIGGKDIGFPMPVVIFALVVALAYFMLNHTRLGRRIFAVGGNAEAARLSGISITRTKVTVFAISGLLAALSAIMLTARMNACDPTLGIGYNVNAISAAVIGGATMSGGEGNVLKTVIGATIIIIISNILNMVNVSPYVQQVITGTIIFTTVYIDNVRRQKKGH